MDSVTEVKSPVKQEMLASRQKPQKNEKPRVTNTSGEAPRQTLERFANLPNAETKISDVPQIPESRNQVPLGKEHMAELVEPPLLPACEELFDRGVQTLSSSANKTDIDSGYGNIVINYDSLSQRNKEVARSIAGVVVEEGREKDPNSSGSETTLNLNPHWDGHRTLTLKIPIDPASTVGDVSEASLVLSTQFKDQPMSWIKPDTFQALCEANGISPTDVKPQDFVEEFGYYLDQQSGLFYPNKEIFDAIKKHENDPT